MNFARNKILIQLLHKQKEKDKYLAAICASPVVVLEGHGFLSGEKATCYPTYADKLIDSSKAKNPVVVSHNISKIFWIP
jgi:4-methyl-5(b-hydroxyethyl)-thiazole monophosphate biosynthesis